MAEKEQCRGCEVTQMVQASVTERDGRGVRVVLIRNQEAARGVRARAHS